MTDPVDEIATSFADGFADYMVANLILGVGDRCEHDDLTKQWTCCVQNEGETC